MKLFLTADPHLSTPMGLRFLNTFEAVLKEEHPDAVIVAGDHQSNQVGGNCVRKWLRKSSHLVPLFANTPEGMSQEGKQGLRMNLYQQPYHNPSSP